MDDPASADALSEQAAADRFAALGSPARLRVLRMLNDAAGTGLRVGELQRRCGIPASTLAHHLAALADARLIHQERCGREVICTATSAEARALRAFLRQYCNVNETES
jgi:DNA-binding transcriptional ArsR family regulator